MFNCFFLNNYPKLRLHATKSNNFANKLDYAAAAIYDYWKKWYPLLWQYDNAIGERQYVFVFKCQPEGEVFTVVTPCYPCPPSYLGAAPDPRPTVFRIANHRPLRHSIMAITQSGLGDEMSPAKQHNNIDNDRPETIVRGEHGVCCLAPEGGHAVQNHPKSMIVRNVITFAIVEEKINQAENKSVCRRPIYETQWKEKSKSNKTRTKPVINIFTSCTLY